MTMSHWAVPRNFRVKIGGNTYTDCPTIVRYKGDSLFELVRSERDGLLAINFDLYGKDGTKVATIRNGRFVDYEPDGYIVGTTRDHFVLREATTGRKVCEIRLRQEARDYAELDVAAKMYMPDGRLIEFDPDESKLPGIRMVGNTFHGVGTAIDIT
jgi:hypothetical protein